MATAVGPRYFNGIVFELCGFLLILYQRCAAGKWVEGTIDISQNWHFLTRFCFLSKDGNFDYYFKYPTSYKVQQLLLYYDVPGQWESVYKSNKNCTERRSILSKKENQIIDLTVSSSDSRPAGCEIYFEGEEEYLNCTSQISFETARERWWYIVVAHCNSADEKRELRLDYKLHMINGKKGDFLHHELSADEFYILPVDIAFLIVYLVLLALACVCAGVLQQKQMFHMTYKMYIVTLCFWLFGLLLLCIAWGMFCTSGWEQGPTEVTGRLFQAASTAVFILMLLLLAKGFTVTRGPLTQISTVKLIVFFFLYIVVNVTLFIWEGMFFDEALVLYFYESPPGYGLITVRLCAWLWFLYAFAFTIKHHPEKRSFYLPFFTFYTLWFWAGPVVNLIAMMSAAKWSREQIINGVEQFVGLCGHLFFLFLSRPSAANANFPFHLRTTQVSFSAHDSDGPEKIYMPSEDTRQHLETLFVTHHSQRAPGGNGHSSLDLPVTGTSPGSAPAATFLMPEKKPSLSMAPEGSTSSHLSGQKDTEVTGPGTNPDISTSIQYMESERNQPDKSLEQRQVELFTVTPGQRNGRLPP